MHVLQQNTVKTAGHAAWLDPTKRVIVLSGIMEIGVSIVSKQLLSLHTHCLMFNFYKQEYKRKHSTLNNWTAYLKIKRSSSRSIWHEFDNVMMKNNVKKNTIIPWQVFISIYNDKKRRWWYICFSWNFVSSKIIIRFLNSYLSHWFL